MPSVVHRTRIAPRCQVRSKGVPARSSGVRASVVADAGGRWLTTTVRGLAQGSNSLGSPGTELFDVVESQSR